jgi:hypothetical protein
MVDMSEPFNMYLSVCFRVLILIIFSYFLFTSLNGKPSGIIVLIGLVFVYLYIYFMSRAYLEKFEDASGSVVDDYEPLMKNNDIILDSVTKSFMNKPINSLDDYEYNSVFENENDRELTKGLRNKLMSQYPMDWSIQPPSSTYFQQGLKDVPEGAPVDASGIDMVYEDVDGTNTQPIDMDSVEMKERQILKTYIPKKTSDLKTYDVDDAYTLIKNMYNAKGLIPEVKHNKDTNIYEVIGTRKIGEKVRYEDEDVGETVESDENSVTVVPPAAKDFLNDSDPFYNTHNKTRMDKWDYTKYTESLERMFAPSYPRSQWY